MALSVCLLPDPAGSRAVRGLWERLEESGVRTLLTHTHGRHVPHLTVASLLTFDLEACRLAVVGLAQQEPAAPTVLRFDALGMFPRSRCWLAPAAVEGLPTRQERIADLLAATGAEVHRSYRAGVWVPHLTLAPRLHLDDLPVVARRVFEVLPLSVTMSRSALIDTHTGMRVVLPHPL